MRKERLLQLSKTFALRQMKQRPWQEIIVVSQVVTLNIPVLEYYRLTHIPYSDAYSSLNTLV